MPIFTRVVRASSSPHHVVDLLIGARAPQVRGARLLHRDLRARGLGLGRRALRHQRDRPHLLHLRRADEELARPAQGPQHDRAERCERPGGRISERDGDCDDGSGPVDAIVDFNENDLTPLISDVQMKSGNMSTPAQGPQHDRAELCERPGGRISERDGDCDDGSGPVSRMSRTLTV